MFNISSDRCLPYLNLLECKNELNWFIKFILLAFILFSLYFFIELVPSVLKKALGANQQATFWVSLIMTEIFHFLAFLIPFNTKNLYLLYLSDFSRSFVYLIVASQAIVLIRLANHRLAAFLGIVKNIFYVIIAISISLTVFNWTVQIKKSRPIISTFFRYFCIIFEILSKGFFVLVDSLGFIFDKKVIRFLPDSYQKIMKINIFVTALLSIFWIAYVIVWDSFEPNFAYILVAQNYSKRRNNYIYILSIVDFFANDVPLLFVAISMIIILRADVKSADPKSSDGRNYYDESLSSPLI